MDWWLLGGRVCDVFSAKDIDGSLCGFPLGRNTMVNRYGEQVAGGSRKIFLSALGQYLTAKGRLCWKAKVGRREFQETYLGVFSYSSDFLLSVVPRCCLVGENRKAGKIGVGLRRARGSVKRLLRCAPCDQAI